MNNCTLKVLLFACCFALFANTKLQAQGSPDYGSGIKIPINTEGTKYIRFITWNQIWARYIQNNPGTAVNGTPTDHTFDIGIRRARFLAYAQISPRYLVLTHFGINNQTFLNGGAAGTSGTGANGAGKKPGLFFHDVWNEYAIVPTKNPKTNEANKFSLSAGFGLHYWHGLSRMTSASTLNFLMIDAPIFNWQTIETSDQFARQFGMYIKGKAGKLDYRFHLNKPFATNIEPNKKTPNIAVENNSLAKSALGGYVMYQFKDQESNVLPFTVGSYLGTKKVFNVGLGFYNTAQGTASYQVKGQDTTLTRHNITNLGADVFLDMPFGGEKNMAVTLYSVFYNYDFGPNFYRSVGIMNVGTKDAAFTGTASRDGYGNTRPLLGTGQVWYTQAGLLLPKGFITTKARIQPFASYTLKSLDLVGKPLNFFDAGLNYYIDGHHAKLTIQYSTRPLMDSKNNSLGNKGELLFQTQIYL